MDSDDLTTWMLEEHTKVAELAAHLRQRVASAPRGDPARWIAELRREFDEFFLHMARHLELEEAGGYLAQVVELRPTLAQAVEIIRHEHEELSQIFREVQEAVHELGPADVLLLRDCCKRIEYLLTWLERHEEHENHVVVYAFTQDFGGPD
jgi:hemerythrin-like domain-containing protein